MNWPPVLGMSTVPCWSSDPNRIHLDDFHDTSQYYMYEGAHGRISAKYKPGNQPTDPPIIVENPGNQFSIWNLSNKFVPSLTSTDITYE